MCPAEPTGRGGSHGGAWVLAQRSLESHGFLPGAEGSQLIGDQWTAAAVRLKGFDVVFVAVYLVDGIGLAGANIDRLGSLPRFLEQLSVPYIIMGDWNLEPSELEMARWPEFVRGEFVQPSGPFLPVGRGRAGYWIMRLCLIGFQFTSPWKPTWNRLGPRAKDL